MLYLLYFKNDGEIERDIFKITKKNNLTYRI